MGESKPVPKLEPPMRRTRGSKTQKTWDKVVDILMAASSEPAAVRARALKKGPKGGPQPGQYVSRHAHRVLRKEECSGSGHNEAERASTPDRDDDERAYIAWRREVADSVRQLHL